MSRITRSDLEKWTADLNARLGRPRPPEPTSIILDYYDGYALREMQEAGAQAFFWPRWERVTGREIAAFIAGMHQALDEKEKPA